MVQLEIFGLSYFVMALVVFSKIFNQIQGIFFIYMLQKTGHLFHLAEQKVCDLNTWSNIIRYKLLIVPLFQNIFKGSMLSVSTLKPKLL